MCNEFLSQRYSAGQFDDENAIVKRLSLVSIVGNTVLSVFKLSAGIFGHSGAMISDAVHSISDVITTLIAFLGAKISKKPADRGHPYGHDRLECVAALILGLILLFTGFGVGKAGIQMIIAGNCEMLAVPGVIALAAAIFSIIGKEAMYRYTKHYAKIIGSSAFMADAWHHRSDALSSVGSLIGIGGAMLGFPVMDPVASVIICLIIFKVSCDILWDALKKMLDTPCDADYEKMLSDYISSQKGVIRVDLLQSRMFGNKVYVDLEIAVEGDKPLRAAHVIAENVHNNVERSFPEIKHIMIHMNPEELQ